MEKGKHTPQSPTPGPWKQNAYYVYASGETGANICVMSAPRATTHVGYTRIEVGDKDADEAYANARLISAAPDMLAALEKLWEWVWEDNRGDCLYPEELVRAAIRKARGESP